MEDVDDTTMVSKKSIHNLRIRAARSQSYIAQCKRHWCNEFFMQEMKGPTALCGALREMRRSGGGSLQHPRMGVTGRLRKIDHRARNT